MNIYSNTLYLMANIMSIYLLSLLKTPYSLLHSSLVLLSYFSFIQLSNIYKINYMLVVLIDYFFKLFKLKIILKKSIICFVLGYCIYFFTSYHKDKISVLDPFLIFLCNSIGVKLIFGLKKISYFYYYSYIPVTLMLYFLGNYLIDNNIKAHYDKYKKNY